MKPILLFTTLAEAATGLALIATPSLVARLLFGQPLEGPVAFVTARVAGVALLALAAGCWRQSARFGMLTYSALVTALLAVVAMQGDTTGLLLWPVIALHAALTVLLALSRD